MTQLANSRPARTNKRAASVSAPADSTKRVRLTTDGGDTTDVDSAEGADGDVAGGFDDNDTSAWEQPTLRYLLRATPLLPPPDTAVEATAAQTPAATGPVVDVGFADKAAFPDATTEAAAVLLLNGLGAEPGALVGLDLAGLNAIYRTLLHEKIAAGMPPYLSSSAKAPASLPTILPADMRTALETFSRVGVPAEKLAGKDLSQMRRLYAIIIYFDKTRCVGRSTVLRFLVTGTGDSPLHSTTRPISSVQRHLEAAHGVGPWGAISVQPLSGRLHDTSKNLLNSLSSPRNTSLVAAAFGPDQFRATRWMTVRGQRGQPSSVIEFSDYYDARTVLKDKLLMEKIGVNQIMEHDLVLIEARIGRYNSEPAGEARGKKRVMNNWQTFYDLQAIYLIQNASAVAAPVVADDLMI
ncbi:hypothetical protein DFH08DRAFT_969899 [Mycena albidolilacea]|uniref:Uncharacterized protein n=1 Tax=Mycena albidolilacea TaxID=1033008 RepID=A0AAD7EGW4_9AGAR|nr:hypothetical protein DFH08DRAFT_969899 [Mycena albidolilacea]